MKNYKMFANPLFITSGRCIFNSYKKDISTLERVERKAARFCLQNFNKTASVTDMLSELKWDTLEIRRESFFFLDQSQYFAAHSHQSDCFILYR